MTVGARSSDFTLTRAMQDYYAARAPEYDAIYAKPERQSQLREIEAWLAATLAGRSVLEVACGTGYWTRHFAPAARRVLGIDASEEVLALARDRMTSGDVAWLRGDAYRLPVSRGRFDAAFAGFWISHVPHSRRQDFLRGLHEVLQPAARVVFLDNVFVEGSSMPLSDTDPEDNTYQLRQLRDGTTHPVLKNFPTERELRALVAGSSRDVRYRAWRNYWALEYTVED